jgi:hypothetical protein
MRTGCVQVESEWSCLWQLVASQSTEAAPLVRGRFFGALDVDVGFTYATETWAVCIAQAPFSLVCALP